MASQTYMDRAMRSADPRYARVLEKLGHTRPAAPKANVEEPANEAAALRAEYEGIVGKRPFMGWDAAKLREKIAEAKAEG